NLLFKMASSYPSCNSFSAISPMEIAPMDEAPPAQSLSELPGDSQEGCFILVYFVNPLRTSTPGMKRNSRTERSETERHHQPTFLKQ
ncbi:hypothetical protein NPIL_501181, partial [Nephila pilipes]